LLINVKVPIKEERRRFFRINLPLPLESVLEVLEIKGRKVNVGNTKVLIKNIGPGGLCFVSDIKFPVQNSIILQFTFQLLDEEIKVRGNIVWAGKTEDNLNQYGIEFTIDENERADLIKILNQVQIKVRKNILFSEGSFVSVSYSTYFKDTYIN